MNLKPEDLIELNKMLASPKLELPPFRREVTKSGANYKWLQKHVVNAKGRKPGRLLELLAVAK